VTSISTHAYIMGRVIRRSKLVGGTGLGLQLHKLLLIVLPTTPENAPPSLATTTVGYCFRVYCPISASPDSRHRTWPKHGMMTSGKLQQPSLEVSGPYWKASYFCIIMQGCFASHNQEAVPSQQHRITAAVMAFSIIWQDASATLSPARSRFYVPHNPLDLFRQTCAEKTFS
jgi:hypothetical protein